MCSGRPPASHATATLLFLASAALGAHPQHGNAAGGGRGDPTARIAPALQRLLGSSSKATPEPESSPRSCSLTFLLIIFLPPPVRESHLQEIRVSALLQRSPTYETSAWARELSDAPKEGTNANKLVLPGSATSCPVHQCPHKPCTAAPSPAPSRSHTAEPPDWCCHHHHRAALHMGPAHGNSTDQKNKEKWGPFCSQRVMLPWHSPPAKCHQAPGRGHGQRLRRRSEQHPELLPWLFHTHQGNYPVLPSPTKASSKAAVGSYLAAQLSSSGRETSWDQHPASAKEPRLCHAEPRGSSPAPPSPSTKQTRGLQLPKGTLPSHPTTPAEHQPCRRLPRSLPPGARPLRHLPPSTAQRGPPAARPGQEQLQ